MFWIIFAFVVSSKCFALALYAWRNRSVPAASIFVPFSLLLALWAAGYGMELLSADLARKLWWAKVEYFGIATLPVVWFALMLKYAHRARWLRKRVLSTLAAVPAATLLILWTNELHGLFWRSAQVHAWDGITLLELRYGPWFWVHTAYSYALLFAGIGLLVWMLKGSRYLYRKQSLSLLVGGLTPITLNVLYLFFPNLPIDLTPYGFGLGMLAVALGFFYFYVPDPLFSARAVVIENMADSVIVLDARHRVVNLNRAAQSLLAQPIDQVIGQNIAHSLPTWSGLDAWLRKTPDEPKEVSLPVDQGHQYYRLSVSPVHEPRAEFSGQVLVIQDITEAKMRQLAVERMAYSDALTGLTNRRGLLERGEQLLRQAEASEQSAMLFYLDLNRFKNINDMLGHTAGDQLLAQAAERLEKLVRAGDLLARLGGDEFALMTLGLTEREAHALTGRILAELRRPFSLQGHTLHVDASVGIAVHTCCGGNVDDLLKSADIAMYSVKEGRTTSPFYSDALGERRRGLLALEEQLRGALREETLRLCYQPISSLQTRRIVGAEALLRWEEGGHEVAAPTTFIPFAEELGLIREIDEWVLAEVLKSVHETPKKSDAPAWVSVNVSPRSFRNGSFTAYLAEQLGAAQLEGGAVMLEITESAFMDPGSSLKTLRELKAMGLRIAVDDFGTGYSSLSYLEQLPIDVLKIDKSFVWGIGKSSAKEAIVRTIITLAHNLGISVLAEGVETDAQMCWLKAEGCDLAQGYLLGKPQSPQTLLRRG